MEVAALAAVVVTAIAVVAVISVVVVAMAGAVGAVTVGVNELACWTKAGQVAFPAGLGPCLYPSPAFGGINPYLDPAPLLQRSKKQQKGVRNRWLHI